MDTIEILTGLVSVAALIIAIVALVTVLRGRRG